MIKQFQNADEFLNFPGNRGVAAEFVSHTEEVIIEKLR